METDPTHLTRTWYTLQHFNCCACFFFNDEFKVILSDCSDTASTVVNTQVQKHFMFKQILRQHLTNIVVKEGNVEYWRVNIWSIFSSCNIVQLSIDWESKPRDNIINKLKRENIFKYCPSLPQRWIYLRKFLFLHNP